MFGETLYCQVLPDGTFLQLSTRMLYVNVMIWGLKSNRAVYKYAARSVYYLFSILLSCFLLNRFNLAELVICILWRTTYQCHGREMLPSLVPFVQLHPSFGFLTFSVAFLQLFSSVPEQQLTWGEIPHSEIKWWLVPRMLIKCNWGHVLAWIHTSFSFSAVSFNSFSNSFIAFFSTLSSCRFLHGNFSERTATTFLLLL